jgi:hypothetical protein
MENRSLETGNISWSRMIEAWRKRIKVGDGNRSWRRKIEALRRRIEALDGNQKLGKLEAWETRSLETKNRSLEKENRSSEIEKRAWRLRIDRE